MKIKLTYLVASFHIQGLRGSGHGLVTHSVSTHSTHLVEDGFVKAIADRADLERLDWRLDWVFEGERIEYLLNNFSVIITTTKDYTR